jgi:Protein NO VEIN, C-terminal
MKYIGSGPIEPVNRLIEVKSSTQNPPRMILTRGEWEAAIRYGDSFVKGELQRDYRMSTKKHGWLRSGSQKSIVKLCSDSVRDFIPPFSNIQCGWFGLKSLTDHIYPPITSINVCFDSPTRSI